MKQTKAKIYLSDDRGLSETDWFRSRNSFLSSESHDESKQPFGNIYVLNDDTLAGNRSRSMVIEENTKALILPLIGAVKYRDNQKNDHFIVAGQAIITCLIPGTITQVSNPFEEDPVNFLQLWFRNTASNGIDATELITYEDVDKNLNQLVRIGYSPSEASLTYSISIGKFKKRGETVYKPVFENPGIFLFVLEGAFEVEGRLLHPRDALAIWETGEIEMVAQSNDAIILLVEQPLIMPA